MHKKRDKIQGPTKSITTRRQCIMYIFRTSRNNETKQAGLQRKTDISPKVMQPRNKSRTTKCGQLMCQVIKERDKVPLSCKWSKFLDRQQNQRHPNTHTVTSSTYLHSSQGVPLQTAFALTNFIDVTWCRATPASYRNQLSISQIAQNLHFLYILSIV